MICIPFDQYQRYRISANIIEQVRQKESYRILEVGANEHKNLEKFLPNDQIYYLDIELPEHLINDPSYFLADATDLNIFENNEFDFILAMDTFEHIPKDRRESFVKELTRVGKHVIIAGPFSSDNQEVELTELRLNNYYKALFDYDFRWLIEHIENGLPSMRNTCDLLDGLGHEYFVFQHGDIELWEKMFRIHFLNESTEGKYKYYKDYADTYYIEKCFSKDFSDKCYRSFLLINIPFTAANAPYSTEILDCGVIDRILEDFERLWEKYDSFYKEEQVINEDHFLQIFELCDNGYDERCSTMIQGLTGGKQIITVDKCVTGLRLDFGNTMCQIIFEKIEVFDDKFNLIPITIDIGNGFKIGNCFIFFNDDPQILIKMEGEFQVSRIIIDYKYLAYQSEEIRESIKIISDHVIGMSDDYIELNNESLNLKVDIKYYKQELDRQQKIIADNVEYIESANNNYRELVSNIQRLEGDIKFYKQELERQQKIIVDNVEHIESANNDYRELASNIQKLEGDIKFYKQELERQQKIIVDNVEHIESVNNDYRELVINNQRLESDIKYYKQELERQQKIIADNVEYIEAANNNYRVLASNNQRLDGEYSGIVNLMKVEKEHSKQLVENIKALDEQLVFSQNHIKNLNLENMKLIDCDNNLLLDIKQLREMNERYQNEIMWLSTRKWWHIVFNVKKNIK